MKDGQGLSATLGTNSDLPHRCREGCNFSVTECSKVAARRISARTVPPGWAELSWGQRLADHTMTLSSGTVSRDFLRFRQRAYPLVIVELLRSRVLLLLQEHQLRIEQEAALLRQVARRPLDCQNVKLPRSRRLLCPAPSEGDNGIQVFLPFSSGTRGTHGRQIRREAAKRCLFCFVPAPSSRSALVCIALHTRRFRSALSTLHAHGMSSKAPELRGMRAVVHFLRQSAEPCTAPPTNPFMALLKEPRAVKAHARFPRCSSVRGCVFPVVLRSGPEFC